MKVKRLHIKNFKSIKELEIELSDEDRESDTAILIGSNNVGKSNILKALELFFNYDLKTNDLSKEMFYQMQTDKPIEIEVELFKFTNDEKNKYKDYIIKNNDSEIIKIMRKINLTNNDRYDYKYYIYKQQPRTEWLQKDKVNSNNIMKWWEKPSTLQINGLDFFKFIKDKYNIKKKPTVEQWIDAIEEFIEKYKNKIPFEPTPIEDDKEIRNFIKSEFNCIFIPAISETTEITKKVLTKLISEYIKETITNDDRKVINKILMQTKEIIEDKYYKKIKESLLQEAKNLEIKDIENINIGHPYDADNFIEDATKQIQLLINDGIESSIESKGHGIQRPLIMCLLKLYKSSEDKGDVGKNLLLLIEEPELYLHVRYQQVFYDILHELSKQNKVQVIYSTHSNYFVDFRYFDEICVIRKDKTNGTSVAQLPARYLVEDLKNRYPNTNSTVKSMKDIYSHFFDPRANEGFFADKVILVEGPSEIYVLPRLMKIAGFDIVKHNIAIISTNGIDSMDRYYRIFNEFKIPTYIIIDNDNKKKIKELIALIEEDNDKLLGAITNSSNNTSKLIVGNKIAMFVNELEDFLKDLIGTSNYENYCQEARHYLGLDKKSKTKSKPLINRYIVEKASKKYKDKIENNAELKELIKIINNLNWSKSCLKRS